VSSLRGGVALNDVVSARILTMVKSEDVDFGVGSFPDAEPDIHTIPLFADRMRIIFPPGSPLEHKRQNPLRLLPIFP